MTRTVKFSDCVEYMIKGPFGSDMKKSLYVPKGDDTYKVYVQGNAIQQDETLGDYYVSNDYFHQKLERFEVHPGDYIITCDGTLGKYIKLSESIEKGVISSSLLLLKLKETIIYDKYFEILWDNSILSYLASRARNACLVHLPSAKAIGDVLIELPSLEEQKEKADKAFKIKKICEYRSCELAMLDELIKARFVEMFGDPEFNDKGWSTRKLSTLCVVGSSKRIYQEEQTMDGVPFWRISDLVAKMDTGNVESSLFIPESRYIELKSQGLVPEPGDILVTSRGTLGRCYIISEDDRFYFQDGMISWLSHYSEEISPLYIQYLFEMRGFRKQIDGMQAGSTVAYLSIAMLKKLNIMVPDLDLQKQFAAFVAQVDKSKAAVKKSLDKTQVLYDSLMQKYFG